MRAVVRVTNVMNKYFHSGRDGGGSGISGTMEVVMLMVGYHW